MQSAGVAPEEKGAGMSSSYMGADATGTLPVQFCQKCGQALGTSWSIEGGLNFHSWCAPSFTQGTSPTGELKLLVRIAELEAENERLRVCAGCLRDIEAFTARATEAHKMRRAKR